MGLNVVGRVLRDRGIGNYGRESLSVGGWEDWSVARRFVRMFFVVLDFFCIFVAWYFVFIPYFVLKLK